MKILFLTEDWPITPDGYGGASSLIYSHLKLLASGGHQIFMVMLFNPFAPLGFSEFIKKQPDVWEGIKTYITSYYKLDYKEISKPKIKLIFSIINKPEVFVYPFIDAKLIAEVWEIINFIKPDLIWTEHLIPAILATKTVKNIPIIYSHHDWLWKIKSLRHNYEKPKTLKSFMKFLLMKHIEESVVCKVTGCVSASATEAEEIKKLGCKSVVYFPPTFEPVYFDEVIVDSIGPRIIHLGGMRTTATRQGLERFFDIVWLDVCKFMPKPPPLWIVGDLRGTSENLLSKMKKANAYCSEFVQDLRLVLRPFDICIIPWEYNTGTRTRLIVAFNFAQVVIATKASVACIPEAKDGYNCILVNRLSEMANQIISVCRNESLRKKLGQEARETFLRSFTREVLQERFNKFVGDCYKNP